MSPSRHTLFVADFSYVQTISTDALLVIDMQNDFCPGGALAVPEGDQIVPIINRLAQHFEHVILTQDWHPTGHISFASSHPGTKPFENIEVAYGTQTLWPDHCVQGTPGADFHPGLNIPHTALILRKGFRKDIDSYSAFLEDDHKTPTGLTSYLRERGLKRLFLCGLAYDFCVRASAIDGTAVGFECIVIEDATRAVRLSASVEDTHASFAGKGIRRIHSTTLPRLLDKK
jgi:nicotinamidase/pyrazinamidase